MRSIINVLIQPRNGIFYGTLAFTMLCHEMFPGKLKPRSPLEILRRCLLWPLALPKLSDAGWSRFGKFVWAGVITGWLWNLVYFQVNKYHLSLWIAIAIWEMVMFFVTVCIYKNPRKKMENIPHRTILLYGVFWFYAIPKWLLNGEISNAYQYSEAIWAILTTGWLITLLQDNIDRSGNNTFLLLVALEALMAFIVCGAGSQSDWYPGKNEIRIQSLAWFATIPYWYFKGELRILSTSYQIRVWNLLLIGWFWGLCGDSTHQLEIFKKLLWF